MKTTCNLSVSIARFESEKKNSLETSKSDESGFHTNMRRSFAWSRVGTRPVVKTPVTRAVTHTVLGAITADAVIHLSLRKPAPPKPKPKKAKTNKRKKKDVEAEAAVEEE
ncbi:hypothetical protein G6F64_011534 [Rhizopus arrhizus]|uniref:Uncharacterized protein n=1 Tax=Rhizopus oryzae TaxID=64495 RepID=A0A9P6WZB7_RHIOR|nr:hypothetical protein G6F64_011534 [Rhizopus arrhizus]